MVQTLDAVLIALMHGIDAQESRPALRRGLAPLADGDGGGARVLIGGVPFPVAGGLAQPVNLRDRDGRQTLESRISVIVKGALEQFLSGRSAQVLVRVVAFGQQFDVGGCVARGEAASAVGFRFHFLTLPIGADQPCGLGPAQARHLGHIASHQPFGRTRELGVIVMAKRALDPAVDFGPVARHKAHLLAGFQKRPDLLQTQLVGIFHADGQSPACGPSGSSCVRNKAWLQAHLV